MGKDEISEIAELLSGLVVESSRCVVFTGAGISTASGIPDFRSPGGIWSRYDPEEFTYQKFMESEENRRKRWKMFRETTNLFKAAPNAAHVAIADLERIGKLDCVITQNIDNLHQTAGNSKVIELHGNALWVKCLDCGARYTREEIQQRLEAGEVIPACSKCNGMLKSATVMFGESMPEKETREAYERSQNSDLFIVIGSSLVVQPAASMPLHAKRSGAKLVILNLSPTPLDRLADVVAPYQATDIMPSVVKKVRQKLNK